MATISKKQRMRLVSLALGLILVILILAMLYRNHQSKLPAGNQTESAGDYAYRHIQVGGEKYRYNSDLMTILCLGVDTVEEERGQTDAIYLMVLDRAAEKIKIISISRDAMLPIRIFDANGKDLGWERQHLGLAYGFGSTKERGCLLVEEAVSKAFGGVPMIYYAAADIALLPKMQKLVDSLKVTVPDSSLEYLGTQYQEGSVVTITQDNVEEFVRSRNTDEAFSNESRMKRQQVFVEAYLKKLKELLTIDFTGIVSDMSQIITSSTTNIGIDEISDFANMLLQYEFSDEDYYILEGENQSGMFHDEFLVDDSKLEQLILNVFYIKEEEEK